MLRGERYKLVPAGVEKRVGRDRQRHKVIARNRCKRIVDFSRRAGAQDFDTEAKSVCRVLNLSKLVLREGKFWIL